MSAKNPTAMAMAIRSMPPWSDRRFKAPLRTALRSYRLCEDQGYAAKR